jgi:hypothetical protein
VAGIITPVYSGIVTILVLGTELGTEVQGTITGDYGSVFTTI